MNVTINGGVFNSRIDLYFMDDNSISGGTFKTNYSLDHIASSSDFITGSSPLKDGYYAVYDMNNGIYYVTDQKPEESQLSASVDGKYFFIGAGGANEALNLVKNNLLVKIYENATKNIEYSNVSSADGGYRLNIIFKNGANVEFILEENITKEEIYYEVTGIHSYLFTPSDYTFRIDTIDENGNITSVYSNNPTTKLVNNRATIVLLKDIDDEYLRVFSSLYSVAGNITFDLNGKTIDRGTADGCAIMLYCKADLNLTITIKNGTLKAPYCIVGEKSANSGTFIFDNVDFVLSKCYINGVINGQAIRAYVGMNIVDTANITYNNNCTLIGGIDQSAVNMSITRAENFVKEMEIGTTTSLSFNNKIQNNDRITLLKTIDLGTSSLSINMDNITLDLNGYNISSKSSSYVVYLAGNNISVVNNGNTLSKITNTRTNADGTPENKDAISIDTTKTGLNINGVTLTAKVINEKVIEPYNSNETQ